MQCMVNIMHSLVFKHWKLLKAIQCRSIVISGTIGIGKTALARQLLEQIKGEFDEIVWQSVGSKRSLVEFIDRNLFPSLSISSLPEPPLDLEARISGAISTTERDKPSKLSITFESGRT